MPKPKNCPNCHRGPALEGELDECPHFICTNCEFAGPVGKDVDEARRLWNRITFSRPKKPSSCKEKGSEFERQMCRRFSLWLSEGESDDLLWRNKSRPNRRVKGRRRFEQFGDAHAIDPRADWFMKGVNLEFKDVEELDLLEVIDKPKKKGKLIFSHWEQCERDAKDSSRVPLLVQKRNFGEPSVMCRAQLMTELFMDEEFVAINLITLAEMDVALFSLNLLFDHPPERFRRAVEDVLLGMKDD